MVLKVKKESILQEESYLVSEIETSGLISENIMHFARVLRRAGLPVGPGQVLNALRAVMKIGVSKRNDFYWTLHAAFITRLSQREVFDQAFHIFWRNPDILNSMMQLILPDFVDPNNVVAEPDDISRRVAEALSSDQGDHPETVEEKEVDFDVTSTWSANELFSAKDFEKMSADEIQLAIATVHRMRLPLNHVATRRFKFSNRQSKFIFRLTCGNFFVSFCVNFCV